MAKKKTTRRSSRTKSQLSQAPGPEKAPAASAGAGNFNPVLPPQVGSQAESRAVPQAAAYDSAVVAEMYGVEQGLVDALDELEYELGFAEMPEDVPRSLAMPEGGQVGMENILGYGVGLKVARGVLTPIPCVKVYVANKVASSAVAEAEIPDEVGGYPTDVEEISPPVAYSPVTCGNGCKAQTYPKYGTLGCLCVRGTKPLILSNNHVLAGENTVSRGTYINSVPGNEYLGRLEDYVPLVQTNDVDAAIAWTDHTTYTSPKHRYYSMNPQPIPARIGMTVKKDGARTQFTMGIVKARIRMLSGVQYSIGYLNFRDVIVVESLYGSYFSQPGDSGSIIVDYSSNQPLALLFAGGGSQTYSISIQTVMSALSIDRFIGGDE